MNKTFHRILVKFSGEALMGDADFGLDPAVLKRIALEIQSVVALGVQVGVVVGGGNLFRGAEVAKAGIDRITGDQMGMLATIMNGLAMRDALGQIGQEARVLSSIKVGNMVDPFNRRNAIDLLNKNVVTVFSGGIGNPFFTTDTTASLRGIEIEADIVLKGTKVDGVYSADPTTNPTAVLYDRLTYDEVLQQKLGVMDLTAVCLCRENNMPLRVFNSSSPGILKAIVSGESHGTLIEN